MKSIKIGVAIYGLILIAFSIWFWWKYGLFYGTRQFPPPITTIVVMLGVFSMIFLMFDNDRIKKIFGEKTLEARQNILKISGVIFTSFILMITLLWSLNPLGLHPHVLYDQSYLLVGLFFYFAGSFYCILADLK